MLKYTKLSLILPSILVIIFCASLSQYPVIAQEGDAQTPIEADAADEGTEVTSEVQEAETAETEVESGEEGEEIEAVVIEKEIGEFEG